jgi:L-arabinokinase
MGSRTESEKKSISIGGSRHGLALPPVAYYVTAHGYGHGVRSCDIIRGLNDLAPELKICIVSDLPESFFRNRLPSISNSCSPGSFDLGMVQLDSIRVDVPASLDGVESLYHRREILIRQEAAFLENGGFGLVATDIPAIPLEAAALAGIPRIAIGNFSWDWIYSAYARRDSRWTPIIQALAEGYAQADLLLRLPFHGDMRAFRKVEDLPLVALPGRERRQEIAGLTGCASETRWILLSFTSLEWDANALERVERLGDYSFLTVLPLGWKRKNIYAIDRDRIPFSDVIASVDAVISKPGFGIVSECIMNGKPLIYADRSDFLEYEPLLEGIRKYLRNIHIPAMKLYQGDLTDALEAIENVPAPSQRLKGGGASLAARRFLDFLPRD